MTWAPRTVLITGGTGFLGSRLVRVYLESGTLVRAVSRSRRGWDEPQVPAGLELVKVDLRDLGRNLNVFADIDLVVHTAGMTQADTDDERMLLQQTNVDVTRNVVEACRRNAVRHLIHVSSTAAIGISPDPRLPSDENTCFNLGHLDLPYNRTKHQAEQLVLDADSPDLTTMVVNPGFMFGPHRESYRGREVIERVLRRHVVVCTDGGLSVVHIDDVVDGIRRVAESGRNGQRYILSGENLDFREIARIVSQVSRERKILVSVPNIVRNIVGIYTDSRFARGSRSGPRLYLDRRYAYQYYSSEKARRELGYQPRSLASIVADALEHIRDRASGPFTEASRL